MPHIERAGCWFVRSGIIEPNGGVARYHRTDARQNARVSTEITGYSVSALVYLYQRKHDEGYLQAAQQSADFLCDDAWDAATQAFPFEVGAGVQPMSYFFDTGIIIRGLLALFRSTADAALLARAAQAGRGLRAQGWHPIVELPSRKPLEYSTQWSRSPGCYQLKSAMAWYDLAEATGDAEFRTWYDEAVEHALSTHETFLPAETPEKTMDRLHAYCYFLEGLLPVNHPVLHDGIDLVSRYLREIRPVFERSDVYAQLLRLRVLAGRLGPEADEEAAALSAFQSDGTEPMYRGGFWFGRKGNEFLPFMNPVSTAFGFQAIDWYNGGPADRQSLI